VESLGEIIIMPIYERQCPRCKVVSSHYLEVKHRDKKIKCEECGKTMVKIPSVFKPKVWKPLTLEHIDVENGKPMTFHSENSLRSYCKKHKVSSGALL
jgi:phage FluMu protein Com